jgi:hypothetical protein
LIHALSRLHLPASFSEQRRRGNDWQAIGDDTDGRMVGSQYGKKTAVPFPHQLSGYTQVLAWVTAIECSFHELFNFHWFSS